MKEIKILIRICTIGFTKKDAKTFFGLLEMNNIKTLIDVRLNNVSQLAGFAKKNDLQYFLERICKIKYVHLPQIAPTKDILDDYKKKIINWDEYQERYYSLLSERSVEKSIDINMFKDSCLLCSEHTAEKCHRRLAVEYLQKHFDDITVQHL